MAIFKNVESLEMITYTREPGSNNEFDKGFDNGVLFILEKLDEIPESNVADIIRCQDCIHYTKPNIEFCECFGALHCIPADFYCAFGERKKVNETNIK